MNTEELKQRNRGTLLFLVLNSQKHYQILSWETIFEVH